MASKNSAQSKSLPLIYRIMPPALLSLIATITYWPSLHYDFQFDDIANIKKHFDIRHYDFSGLFFSGSRWISYWLNAVHYGIGRFDPFSYRLGNLIIHTTNGVLVFFVILFALLHSKGEHFFKRNALAIATATSMLFLLHPVQTQTISYVIQGQLEGLACMAILAMCLTFLHRSYAQTTGKKVGLTVLLFCLALISCGTKEIAFISPFLLMLVDWFFVAHGRWKSFKSRLWIHGAMFCVITGMYLYFLKPGFFTNILGLNMTVKNNIGNVITAQPKEMITPGIFFISQFKVILHYIGMFLWPFNISVEYDWVLCNHILAPDCIFPLLLLIGIGLSIFRVLFTKHAHVICFGALWFFMCIAPRSSIIPSPELLVDYKTYTASIGWLFILAAVLIKLVEFFSTRFLQTYHWSKSRQARTVMVMLFALPLSLMTFNRNTVWRSGTEFWMNIIQNAPSKARAYNNYGVELSQIYKRYEEAVPYFKKATQMDCNYPDPWNNLAVCYSHLENLDDAIEALRQGLQINPYYPEGYNNIASFYLRKKEYDKVEKCLKTALQLRPHYGKAYFNWGRMHMERGDNKQALECFKKACTIADLDNEFGYKTYAQAAFGQKEYADAIWAYHKALECNPAETEVMFSLANAYYLSKQFDQAIKTYNHMLSLKPDDARVWFNLGEAHFMQGDVVQSLECLKRVEPHWQQVPQVCIRLAGCYEKLGDREKARECLNRLAQAKNVHAGLRGRAQQMLVQLDMPGVKVVT